MILLINIRVENQNHQSSLYRVFTNAEIHQQFNKYQLKKINLLKFFIKSAYTRYGLNVPQIFISNEESWQMSSIIGVPKDNSNIGRPNAIILYENNIKNESVRALKTVVYHEIGHVFAPSIIKKHHLFKGLQHLYKRQKFCHYASAVPALFALVALISLVFIPNVLTIIIFLSMIIVAVLLRNSYCNAGIKIANTKNYDQEFIADEFSLRATHDLQGMISSVYERCTFEEQPFINKIQILESELNHISRNNPTYMQKWDHLLRARRRKLHMSDICLHSTDAHHPSDIARINRLRHFQSSGYSKW